LSLSSEEEVRSALSRPEEVCAREAEEILDVIKGLHQGALKALSISNPRQFPGNTRVDALAIWEKSPAGIKIYRKKAGEIDLFALDVDEGLFEKDIKEAFLGDTVAGWLLAPCKALAGRDYLWRQEVLFKRRKVEEALSGLALEYPHLSAELLIEPRYFLFENLCRMIRIYPPISSIYLGFVGEGCEKEIEAAMRGYSEAIRELAERGTLHFKNGYVVLDKGFLEETQRRRFRAVNFLSMVNKTLRPYLIRGFSEVSELLNFYSETEAQYNRSFMEDRLGKGVGDPKKFLHLPTTLGMTSLRDEAGIEDFIRRMEPLGKVSEVRLERCGGVLNEVYVLRFRRGEKEEKALVKKYQNLVGFKWFPLALWTLGTQDFSVLGRSRLEREYAINSLLQRQGYPVPNIHHVDLNRMLLIRDFIEGESLVGTVKNTLSKGETPDEADRLRRLGRLVARAHSLGVTIGDCKPENFIASPSGGIYLIDLEQGAHKGNQVWDLAELLYYSGHYASILTDIEHVSDLTKTIIRGYFEGGGYPRRVEEVGGIQYAKVFSIFTLPQVIYTISKTCREEAEA
jgi:tRNA A-37 threonylcarbamoyl transferase component Bud32